MRRLIIFSIFLFVLASILSCSHQQQPKSAIKNSSIFKEAKVKEVLVVVEEAKVYSNMKSNDIGSEAWVISILKKGDIVKVMDHFPEGYQIVLKDKKVGFILKSSVVPYVEAMDPKENIILEDDLLPEEKELLDLVNEERKKAGLNPLVIDLKLTKIARLKSQDIIENQYFSHYSPTYGSPFDMLEKNEVFYIFAGENLAGNKSAKGAHYALMDSTTHRQNILHPSFTHIGIGMKKGGKYGKIFTQLFVGR